MPLTDGSTRKLSLPRHLKAHKISCDFLGNNLMFLSGDYGNKVNTQVSYIKPCLSLLIQKHEP